MNRQTNGAISIHADVTNPGQFFACCGLLELAVRMTPKSVGWFEDGCFKIQTSLSLIELVDSLRMSSMVQLDLSDDATSAIYIDSPFSLILDWWKDDATGLKTWAGQMRNFRIARAMQYALRSDAFLTERLFDVSLAVYDPDNLSNKVEPFYFDARRGPNAHSRDIGFSPDSLKMVTIARPAVELLCLIGLQRCRPKRNNKYFQYYTWHTPLPPIMCAVATIGALANLRTTAFDFRLMFRTKYMKAFLPSKPTYKNKHEQPYSV